MSLDDSISKLIGAIYDGVHDTTRWDAVAEDLSRRTGSRFAYMGLVDPQQKSVISSKFYGCDDGRFLTGVQEYEDHWHQFDIGAAYSQRNSKARLFDARRVLGDASYFDLPYMRWMLDRMGTSFWQVAYSTLDSGLMFGWSMHGTSDRGPLSEQDERLYLMLFDHMSQAVDLAAMPPAFADESVPAILMDRTGRVRRISSAAQTIVERGDGLRLENGHLRSASRRDQPALDLALKAALGAVETGGVGGTLKLTRPSGQRDVLLKISPLPQPPPPFDAIKPAALLRIVVPDAALPEDARAIWKTQFGLTGAESRLAEVLIGDEGNLRDAAEAIGIAYGTARVHLANMFEKTGTSSQSRLIRLLERICG